MVGGIESHDAECALMHPGCQIDQVYLCRKPVGFRKSIDGLSVLIEQELLLSPFANAQRTQICVSIGAFKDYNSKAFLKCA